MAPARRQNYARTRSRSYVASTPPIVPTMPVKQDLMPPESRYMHNLRVIQRHDPSITSLFDQFPHVCVYHHKGDEWQKKGCEGAMFLFEREEEPKYGFYILNRNNTGDYIQRMTPDDDVEFASAYLIYRAYGKVTSDTIGLWTMVTQDREAMSEVMMRLHSYIKRNIRYPDEYRRRPDTWSTTPAPTHAQAFPLPLSFSSTREVPPSASMSALSNLLSRLGDQPDPPTDPSPPNRAVSASVPPPTTGIPLLDSIFASAVENTPSNDYTSHSSSTGTSALHVLFANGITASQDSSGATSCNPTPTQHKPELPQPFTPITGRSHANGAQTSSTAAGRNPKSYPDHSASNGRLTAPPLLKHNVLEPSKAPPPNGRVSSYSGKSSHPHTMAIPTETQEEEEEGWEEGGATTASVSVDASEHGTKSQLLRRTKARNAKKREREKQKRRSLKQETAILQNPLTNGTEEVPVLEWPLVDDRSLDFDNEQEAEEEASGLGDGLLDALAAVSEPEFHDLTQRSISTPKKKAKERGKDRRKHRPKENRQTPSQTSEVAGDASSSSGSHPVEVRSALLNAYGSRRRVGDILLSEEALAKEVIDLINNDPTFTRELHQQYLRKVQV